MTRASCTEDFFETIYQGNADPWRFATSDYEQNRYDAILRGLEGRRYRRAFEPGCSVGVLTEKLAEICEEVEAMDISPTAVGRTRTRCARLSHVKVQHGRLPENLPDGMFDLIVFSEVGYYFEMDALRELGGKLVERLELKGELIAAHWLGTSLDHVLSGDDVHTTVAAAAGLRLVRSERHEGFRIDKWIRE